MIDFDVITGPGPSEKPREPAPKPRPSTPPKQDAATLPRAALLPHVPLLRPEDSERPAPDPSIGLRSD